MTNTTQTVKAMMNQALEVGSPASVLAFAAEMTKPKSGWKGPRKMSREQALAATRTVTVMLRRYELQPTKVLVGAGRASQPSATGRFYLTDLEMAGEVTKRLATGVNAHVDHVKAIARHARSAGKQVDEAALLTELAEAVGDFLEPFRPEGGLGGYAEMASDVGMIADWLAHPSRGFELARYIRGAKDRELEYRPEGREMVHVGVAGAPFANGVTPSVPILTRVVAWTWARVLLRDAEELASESFEPGKLRFFASPKLEPVGRARCVLCEKVGLGVVAERSGLRMVFTLDPVAYSGVPIGGVDDEDWLDKGCDRQLETLGVPVFGEEERTSDERYWIDVAAPGRFLCADFEAHLNGLREPDGFVDKRHLLKRRLLPVTEETCERLLAGYEGGDFDKWSSFTGARATTVLPWSALDDDGFETTAVAARFADLLYAEDPEMSLAALLGAETRRRMEAYDAFLLQAASGARRRKLAFRARMRR